MEIYRTANEQNLKLARERLAIDKQKLADLEAEKQAREDNKTIEEDMLNLAKAQATKVVVMTDNGFSQSLKKMKLQSLLLHLQTIKVILNLIIIIQRLKIH